MEPDFPRWFFALKTAALASGKYAYETVMEFQPSGWMPLYEVGCPPAHAIALDQACFGIGHQ
jgi:hypothetical protein